MNKHLDLFLTFMKIGMFTFGGGYAMIPMIEYNCVEQRKWITHEEMVNVTIIAESTPGPVSINCSTFVGFKQAGLSGAIVATLGMVIPSFFVIFLIAQFLDNFLEIAVVAHAFEGIKLAVGILILNAGIRMMQKMRKALLSRLILLCALAAVLCINIFALNFSTISLMLIAAAVSLTALLVRENRARKRGEGR